MPGLVAVAYSGGRDSTALLHATATAAKPLGIVVHALHVHHGLSADADEWLAHCRRQCDSWRRRGLPIEFHHRRIDVPRRGGAGLEAEARQRRYAALAEMARAAGCDGVLLAHHRDDQGETFLLQALRGAGVAGLAAMPAAAVRDGLQWLRPWLDRPRAAIEAYLRRHRLHFIDDDSNTSPRFARNRLRLAVWPAMQSAFGDAGAGLAQAARWQAEAQACLLALAQLDLAGVRRGDDLSLPALLELPDARGRNALRHWLLERDGRMPGAAEFDGLWTQLPARQPARWPLAEGGELRRYRGQLIHTMRLLPAPGVQVESVTRLRISRAGRHALPQWGGVLVARRVKSGGVALSRLTELQLRPRGGGERFQRAPGTPPRMLKKQFQWFGVPAWAREGPLVWSDGALVFVPGLGIDARQLAAPGEPQVSLEWIVTPPVA